MSCRKTLIVNRRCGKVCYTSRAKARKKLRWFSGKCNYRQRKAYLCPFPEHEGLWHLTSQRTYHGEAKEQAVDADSYQGQQGGQEEEQRQHRVADVPDMQDRTLE